jgi:hypothetical protein
MAVSSTPAQVVDRIVTYCVNAGWPSEVCIALCCNIAQESSFDPFSIPSNVNAPPFSQGDPFGLFQFANYNGNQVTYDACIKMTTLNGVVDYQMLKMFVKAQNGEWIRTTAYPIGLDDFLNNTQEHEASWLTAAFSANFERSGDGIDRYAVHIAAVRKLYNWENYDLNGNQNSNGNPDDTTSLTGSDINNNGVPPPIDKTGSGLSATGNQKIQVKNKDCGGNDFKTPDRKPPTDAELKGDTNPAGDGAISAPITGGGSNANDPSKNPDNDFDGGNYNIPKDVNDAFMEIANRHKNGQPGWDMDGYFGYQCWDLMDHYVSKIPGIPRIHVSSGAAADYGYTYKNNINNGVNGYSSLIVVKYPNIKVGDIVFWAATSDNWAGHVAIASSKEWSYNQNVTGDDGLNKYIHHRKNNSGSMFAIRKFK